MTTPPTVGRTWDALACRVAIDGTRAADGSLPTDTDAAPFVLAGLTVTWGRTSSIDQPGPGTCTLQLKDWSGDRAFLGLARVGAAIEVDALARIDDPPTNIVADPTLSHLADGQQPYIGQPGGPPALLTVVPRQSRPDSVIKRPDGLHLVERLTRTGHVNPDVVIPPADWHYSPADPAAWDGIRVTNAGQSWSIEATGHLGLWATGTLQPVELRTPADPTARTPIGAPVPLAAGTGVTTAEVTVPRSDRWVGAIITARAATYTATPAGTYADTPAGVTYADLAPYRLDSLDVLGPAETSTVAARVFTGRITDVAASFAAGVTVDVTATDQLGTIAQRITAATPWPESVFADRVADILAAAELDSDPSVLTIDPPYDATTPSAELMVCYQDVDTGSPLERLQALVAGQDLVLWTASHLTIDHPWLWVENPRTRHPVLILGMGAGGLVELGLAGLDPTQGTTLPACDLDLDPVVWTQSAADVITRVAVEWQHQPTPTAQPEGRTLLLRSPLDGSDLYGVRAATLSSQTTSEDVARDLATGLLERLSGAGWRLDGLRWQLNTVTEVTQDKIARALPLLDSRARLGRPIMLTDLPDWAPTPGARGGYLDGGTLTYDGNGWVIDMTIAAGEGLGAGAAYADIPPTWRYIDLTPTITYADVVHAGIET